MRRVVIGIGNPQHGDDAAGRAAARGLRGALPVEVGVEEHDGEAAAILTMFDGVTAAVLVDACVSGAPAGSIHRFDLAAGQLPPTACPISSHGLGLGEALELARALGQLPACCIVYAIEGRSFELGAGLSPPVIKAVDALVRHLRAELGACWIHA